MTSRFLAPDRSGELERRLEVRFDPLLGNGSRIAEGVRLQTAESGALDRFRQEDPECPFCPARLEAVTPRFLPEIAPEGRMQLGESTVFPNLVPYSRYSAVAIFSPRHWLALRNFSRRLLEDNLTAAIGYIRRVFCFDPAATFCAYNINYLYPSGGSLPHPHAQVFLDPHPTTMLRLQHQATERYWKAHGRSYWGDLINEEERRDERFVGQIGNTTWLTPFAPLGFNEVRAVVLDRQTLLDLHGADIRGLADGISRVLGWYAGQGYDSFNLVVYSGPLKGPASETPQRVNLAMVTRTALVPYYRSDAMYLERLHWEAAVDRSPEEVAADLRSVF